MFKHIVFVVLLFSCWASAKKGVIELDSVSWNRIVDGSKPVLVAFLEFSWKDPTDYEKVSEEFQDANVIVAKVDISSNEDLKKQFNIDKFPTFKFFPAGAHNSPLTYSTGETPAELIDFVRVQLNPKLKNLAKEFISKTGAARDAALKQATDIVDKLAETDKEYGKFYLASFKKVAEKGEQFVQTEKERLNGLIANKATTTQKKNEFSKRLNVLNAFSKEL